MSKKKINNYFNRNENEENDELKKIVEDINTCLEEFNLKEIELILENFNDKKLLNKKGKKVWKKIHQIVYE